MGGLKHLHFSVERNSAIALTATLKPTRQNAYFTLSGIWFSWQSRVMARILCQIVCTFALLQAKFLTLRGGRMRCVLSRCWRQDLKAGSSLTILNSYKSAWLMYILLYPSYCCSIRFLCSNSDCVGLILNSDIVSIFLLEMAVHWLSLWGIDEWLVIRKSVSLVVSVRE